jgi:hypothetical protein
MTMRGFIGECVLFVIVQIALVSALLWGFHDADAVSPLAPATRIKHQRLRDAPSPRMILVGGSNLLFGIDSTLIERDTDYHPVNMGLIGGLRLEYVLNEVKAAARDGDLIVLSIEYNTLNAAAIQEEAQVIMGVLAQRPANLRFITWPQWRQTLDHGAVQYAGMVFRQAIANISARSDDDSITQHMNAYGDLTRYHDPNEPVRRQASQNTLVKIHPERVQANIARMNEFIREMQARNVAVAFAYPPIPRMHFNQARSIARRFDDLLRQRLEAPVLVTPAEMTFGDRHFIGLSYHLRGEAVQERTLRLIGAVQRMSSDAFGKHGAHAEPP